MELLRKYNTLLLMVFLLQLPACRNDASMNIHPIDQELNMRLLTGKNLDKDFFSSTDLLQYYQVSGQNGLSGSNLLKELDLFVKRHYNVDKLAKMKTLTIFFYKKSLFNDYSKSLYRDVRESENGSIPNQSGHLIARYTYIRMQNEPGKVQRHRTIYNDKDVLVSKIDTLSN